MRIAENIIAASIVVLLHLVIARALLVQVIPPSPPSTSESSRPSIRFMKRDQPVALADPLPTKNPPAVSHQRLAAARPLSPKRQIKPPTSADANEAAPNGPSGTPMSDGADPSSPSLNLRLPGTYQTKINTAPPGPQTSRRSVDVESTRFNKSWAPSGGTIQESWAFRSKAAELLLSATGALEKPCSAEEKRRREKRCFGAQYQGTEDGLGAEK